MENHTLIAVSIEARTRSELSGKMLENNIKLNAFFRYFDIQKDGKRWVAWYYADVRNQVMEHQLKGVRNG
jgi:hypothetical protein